jgi:hypothetical protein
MKVYSMSVVLLISVALTGIFMQSCSQDEDSVYLQEQRDIWDKSYFEMEEYIIAAFDFKQSLAVFDEELSKVDFSKLEVSYDTNGRKITRLPDSFVGSVSIDEKIQAFNEKRKALLEKSPQLASFTVEMNVKYFRQCIQSSSKVNGRLLELRINYFRPALKSGTVENWNGEDWFFLDQFLSSWVNNANFMELVIITFVDGSYATWIDEGNLADTCYVTIGTNPTTGQHYFTDVDGYNSPIASIAHTHQNSTTPSDADIKLKNKYPDIPNYIYYQGGYYGF